MQYRSYLLWEQGVEGSNPFAPTTSLPDDLILNTNEPVRMPVSRLT